MDKNSVTSGQYTKRDFLKYVLGGSLVAWVGSVLYPVLAFLIPPKQGDVEVSNVMVGKLSEIERDSGMIVRFGNKPVILVRLDSGELRAFDGTCTHLDCTVQYRKDMGVIWCACHNGKYDLTGRNIAGPPPRPLDEYKVVTKQDEIFISKSA
ncbi:MAG: Rieske 2Fe-2S domain-containing protein [Bacteroidetes bacterium]|nr:Rieske 2Fe-2S domain-containing protein [Bacteroidota bacterium]